MTTAGQANTTRRGGRRHARRGRRLRRWGLAAFAVALLGWVPVPAAASPYIWDQDDDRVDDRLESVHLMGYEFSFENADTLARQRIEVARQGGGLLFGVYVLYQQTPTASDFDALLLLGMPVLHRYVAVPAVRSIATFAQAQSVASLPGVERVEAIPLLYPLVHDGLASTGVRDASDRAFPTWMGMSGSAGEGIVIAFLDTGINDEPDGAYPGHESLAGRALGGASFVAGDSTLDTPREGSENPVDRGGAVTQAHATHVAGIAIGSGGPSGYARGAAPSARFVDVKVLNDAGLGTGVAEAIDWCVHNRDRDWNVPGYEGIDIINLSVSSVDQSDGNDVAAQIANAAVSHGIVVVASMGNEGAAAFVPSPAGGDAVLAVGACDPQRTATVTDDIYAAFSNQGPRADDGDVDTFDEQKPDILAPGVAVLSADGDLTTDGTRYHRLSGTSMSAAFVSGVAALIKSAYPSLDPATVATVLRATAGRDLQGVPAGPSGPDPRWHPAIGFGALDLWAARVEIVQPLRSQITRFELTDDDTDITAVISTQREYDAEHFVIERAPDTGDAPGAFAPVDSFASTGVSTLANLDNRTRYERSLNVPVAERGVAFWYRVSYSEGGIRYDGPARRWVSPLGPRIATIELTIVHNAYDSDVSGAITSVDRTGAASSRFRTATSSDGSGARTTAATAPLTFPLPGSSAAVASDWVDGVSATGNVAWTFHIPVADGPVADRLPPDGDHPWWLQATEAGFINRSGRIDDFRVVWHTPGGDLAFTGGPLPQPTFEGMTAFVSIPVGLVDVTDVPTNARPDLRAAPNPVRSGASVRFTLGSDEPNALRIYDVSGRLVGQAALRSNGVSSHAVWEARDLAHRPLAAGVYFARTGRGTSTRILVLDP